MISKIDRILIWDLRKVWIRNRNRLHNRKCNRRVVEHKWTLLKILLGQYKLYQRQPTAMLKVFFNKNSYFYSVLNLRFQQMDQVFWSRQKRIQIWWDQKCRHRSTQQTNSRSRCPKPSSLPQVYRGKTRPIEQDWQDPWSQHVRKFLYLRYWRYQYYERWWMYRRVWYTWHGRNGHQRVGKSLEYLGLGTNHQDTERVNVSYDYFSSTFKKDLRQQYRILILLLRLGSWLWFRQRSFSKRIWLRLKRPKLPISKWKLSYWGFLSDWGRCK